MSAVAPLPPYLRDCGERLADGRILECVLPDGETVVGLAVEPCRWALRDIAGLLTEAQLPGLPGHPAAELRIGDHPVLLDAAQAELWAFKLAAAIMMYGQRLRQVAGRRRGPAWGGPGQ